MRPMQRKRMKTKTKKSPEVEDQIEVTISGI